MTSGHEKPRICEGKTRSRREEIKTWAAGVLDRLPAIHLKASRTMERTEVGENGLGRLPGSNGETNGWQYQKGHSVFIIIIIIIIMTFISMWRLGICSMVHMERPRNNLWVGSVLPPYGFQGSNSGHQAWWQGPRASEPFARPMTHFNWLVTSQSRRWESAKGEVGIGSQVDIQPACHHEV